MRLELRIVDFLARHHDKNFTINEIAKQLNQYYSFANRIVNSLIKEGVVTKNNAGKAYLCSLNLSNEKSIAMLSLAEMEKRDDLYRKNKRLRLILGDFLNSVKEKALSVVIFGSYAKGRATEKSDIDILLIVKKRFPLEKPAREIYSKYGMEINSIIMTEREFKSQINREIIKDIIQSHCILYGYNKFVSLVFR